MLHRLGILENLNGNFRSHMKNVLKLKTEHFSEILQIKNQ